MSIRVVSYNIHGAVGRDRRMDVGRISHVLEEIAGDVIALQEVDTGPPDHPQREQGRAIADLLGLHEVPGPTLRRAHGPYGNALLSRFAVIESSTVDLSVSRREPRGAVIATLAAPDGPLHVIASHLGLARGERREQARRLLDIVARLEGPLVLALDANMVFPWSPTLRRLARPFLPVGAVRSFPSSAPLFALDRIWARGVEPYLLRAHRSPRARRASDHLPVYANLRAAPRR